MRKFEEEQTQNLFEKKFITEEQLNQIKNYRSLDVFSLNAELKMFLYISVLLFTSGVGILIYKNIDTIGHVAILSLLLIVAIVSFYFCFKNSKGFQKSETIFDNPVLDYLVLVANILTCIFIGYLQFQYDFFGTNYGLATLIPTIISFFCAYYFDNKSVLTIAITGLAAYVGFSVTPQDLLDNDFYSNENLSYSAIMLGLLLIFWTIYSTRTALKIHFNLIFQTFALHIISIALINNLLKWYSDIWLLVMIPIAFSSFYFYKVSLSLKAILIYVFMIIYAFIGVSIFLFRIIDIMEANRMDDFILFTSPIYITVSILLFIKLIKDFNKRIAQ
ncbi:DUF2157 domain-containing protein [Flavobacterium sp. LM4]|uniref:DUF2157 domain-containing protein n=1 Tax=Flavobacterium sp. LM4 TaxID=1938609 RepID=UPI000992A286|nr:DUF2157 domain-containing protein [Flavobacterium sp. LM4]OOV16453.1 DUF2157 domain-containing protein [Flavobacterium sp. LM4]